MLKAHLPGKFGSNTGEHGFLYAIKHLARSGATVDALPIATELDLISLNSCLILHHFLDDSLFDPNQANWLWIKFMSRPGNVLEKVPQFLG